MPTVKTCETVMGKNYKAIKRLRVYILVLAAALLVHLVLQGCGGEAGSGYVANGCYCREGYRLARGEGLEAEAQEACASWPAWGYLSDAFEAFNLDPNWELYGGPYASFTRDEIAGYLASGWRVSMNYPVVSAGQCNALVGENCNHAAPVYKLSDLDGKPVEWLWVAGDFQGPLK